MAKIKLNEGHRTMLRNLFRDKVVCPSEDRAVEKAYAKAAPLALKLVHSVHPAEDMDVLRRYGVASQDPCIKVTLTAGGVVQFQFAATDAPWAPKTFCSTRMYLADERATKAVETWTAAIDARQKAWKQKHTDYEALITGSQYLEEVEAVWPEASVLRPKIAGNLPATLTDDAIARIRADAAQRARSTIAATA